MEGISSSNSRSRCTISFHRRRRRQLSSTSCSGQKEINCQFPNVQCLWQKLQSQNNFSVSWCLPLIATAVFQTAIITLGAKSQKVQARELKCIFNLSLILAGLLNAGVPARCPTATGWDFSGTPVDFPFPPSLCDLHISNHLYLHTPHQAITSDMFLIMFPAIRHNDKRPIPQGNIAKAKVGKIIDVWSPHFFVRNSEEKLHTDTSKA